MIDSMTVIVICVVKMTSHTNIVSHTQTDTDNFTEDFLYDFDIFDDKTFSSRSKEINILYHTFSDLSSY